MTKNTKIAGGIGAAVLLAGSVWFASQPPPMKVVGPPPAEITVYVHPDQPPVTGLWGVGRVGPGMLAGDCVRGTRDEYGNLGVDVDKGAIRLHPSGHAEIAGPGGLWQPLDFGRRGEETAVRAYYRWGLGWSCAGRGDAHAGAQDHYVELSTADPANWPPRVKIDQGPRWAGDEPLDDVSYDAQLYARVEAAWAQLHSGDGGPTPTSTPTSTPPQCKPPCQVIAGFCNCPSTPTPTPVPTATATPAPTPTATPTATPCPSCPPPPRCPPLTAACSAILNLGEGKGTGWVIVKQGQFRGGEWERCEAAVMRTGCVR